MKACLLVVALALTCSLALPFSARAQQTRPSTTSPAPGVPPGAPSYPCYPEQIKGDWNSMIFHLPWQASYSGIGSGPSQNVQCFDSEAEAQSFGFRRTF